MRLNQVTVPSIDLYTSVKFYVSLGLKRIVDSLPDYVRFICPDGDSTFSVHRVEELPSGDGIYVYFETEHLEKYAKHFNDQGVAFEGPKDQSWLWTELRVNDPDGNKIILFTAGENRISPPWRINP